MANKCYIIDTESVQNRWGHILKAITPRDNIVAFFHSNCSSLTLGFINAILKSGCSIELISRNQESKSAVAINFQLVTELGYRIANNPDDEYIIVSENTEYDPLIEYWLQRDINISRFNILSSKPDEIPMSYNYRPNDPFKTIREQLPQGENIITLGAAIPAPIEKPDTVEQKETKPKQPVEPKIRYASKKECQQSYYVSLNKLHIPANRSKQLAELIVDIMQKPENQRMLGLYNAMSTAFGKKSPFMKNSYQQVKMLIAEINRLGPLPEATSDPSA